MAPLQRRLEGGLRQTMSVLPGSEVYELAWERAKLTTCFGGMGIRFAQMGFAAQAMYWSAVNLHKFVMTSTCEALNRPMRESHPEEATALAAKTDLLATGVAVDEHARVTIENEASKVYEGSPRTSGLRRLFAQLLRRRLTEYRRKAWCGTWRLMSCSRGFCRLRKRCRLRSYTVKCSQNSRPSCSVRGYLALARAGRPCTSHSQNWHRMRNGGWCSVPRRTQVHAPRVLCGRAMMGTCASSLWRRTLSTRSAASMGEPGPDRTAQFSTPYAGLLSKQGASRTWSAMSLSSTTGRKTTTKLHP